MHLLFPSDPLTPRFVEADFLPQAEAAQAAGFEVTRIDHDALARGEIDRALRFVNIMETPQTMIYRGWMLREQDYAALYNGLIERGWRLINTPQAYANCHHLPGWYQALQDVTPRSVWVDLKADERTPENLPWSRIEDALASFGDEPLVLKDWVKSRKHEWHEACFIPCASDRDAVGRVTRRFVAGQAESLVGGLIYREWLDFRGAGANSQGMPLIEEARWWIVNAQPFFVTSQTSAELQDQAPREWISELAARIHSRLDSRYFTLDVARLPDGAWRVIEAGDGQMSGLPLETDAVQFYTALHARLAD